MRVSPLIWKSHHIKRVVRSTLAAETMAALEAVEHADVTMGHFAELYERIDYRSYCEDIQQTPVIHLTDCRSLCDPLHRRGTVPSERRLLIDIEFLRNDIETNGVVSRWINTKRIKLKKKKRMCFQEKYPKPRRPAEQPYIDAGVTYFNGVLAETSHHAKRVQPPLKNGVPWRWKLGQVEDEGYYKQLEDVVDWNSLGDTVRPRLIPSRVRKLLTVWAPSKKSSNAGEMILNWGTLLCE